MRWITAQLFIDKLFAGLRNGLTPGDGLTQNTSFQPDMMQFVNGMTRDELAACAVLCHVNQCCLTLLSPDASPRVPLSQALDDTTQSLKALLQSHTEARRSINDDFAHLKPEVKVPHGAYLHSAFCSLEVCKGVITFLDTFVANNKQFKQSLPKEQAMSLRKSTDELYQFIRTDATKIKDHLSKNSASTQLVEVLGGREEGETDRIGEEISSLIDTPWTERFGLDLVESWQDAIDGVLQVKIGLP